MERKSTKFTYTSIITDFFCLMTLKFLLFIKKFPCTLDIFCAIVHFTCMYFLKFELKYTYNTYS